MCCTTSALVQIVIVGVTTFAAHDLTAFNVVGCAMDAKHSYTMLSCRIAAVGTAVTAFPSAGNHAVSSLCVRHSMGALPQP